MRKKDGVPLADSIIIRIKNNKFAAALIVLATITTGVIVFWEKVFGVYERHVQPQVTLEAMNLDPMDASRFSDYKGIPCLLQDQVLRTFAPRSEHVNGSALTLAFTFSNRARTDAVFTAVDFVVNHTQETAGGGPGAIVPNATYRMDLKFEKGVQTLRLNPVYRVPANDTGAFNIVMTPLEEALGRCWIMHLVFKTSHRDVTSEKFSVLLSKETRR